MQRRLHDTKSTQRKSIVFCLQHIEEVPVTLLEMMRYVYKRLQKYLCSSKSTESKATRLSAYPVAFDLLFSTCSVVFPDVT